MRDIISLACTTCQRRNYATTKNRRTHPDRLELEEVLQVVPEAHSSPGIEVGNRANT